VFVLIAIWGREGVGPFSFTHVVVRPSVEHFQVCKQVIFGWGVANVCACAQSSVQLVFEYHLQDVSFELVFGVECIGYPLDDAVDDDPLAFDFEVVEVAGLVELNNFGARVFGVLRFNQVHLEVEQPLLVILLFVGERVGLLQLTLVHVHCPLHRLSKRIKFSQDDIYFVCN